jgi:alpha-glucosidase
VVFAGDEFGLEGFNGEDSRTPMPWDARQRIRRDLRSVYAALGRLRKEMPALTEGGVRWLHAQGDALVFVRETTQSSVLVFVARDSADVVLDNSVLSKGQLEALLAAPLHHSGRVTSAPAQPAVVEGVCLRAEGISAGIWELPGTVVPVP